MDFTQLQAIVTGQYAVAQTSFAFDPTPYGSSAINSLLTQVIELPAWTLTAVSQPPQVDAQHQTVTVAGTCATFFGQSDAALTMVFFVDAKSTAQLVVHLSLDPSWAFTTAFTVLKGTIFDDVGLQSGTPGQYVFASAAFTDTTLDNGTFVTGLNFYGVIVPAAQSQVFGYVMSVLGKFVNTTAVGPLSISDGVPNMTLTLGFQNTLTQYFPLLTNHVEIQLVCQISDTNSLVGLLLGTLFDFGNNKSLNIYTMLNPGPLGVLTLTGAFSGVALPTPTQFAQEFQQLIGGNDLYTALPDQYQASTDLYLQRITLGIGLSTLKPVVVTLEIGMPAGDPGWQLGDLATVTQVSFLASVQNPFDSATRVISVAAGGTLALPTAGLPISMDVRGSATLAAGSPAVYEIQAGLTPGTSLNIPVGDLVNKYLPAAVNLPNIHLNQLGVDFKFQTPKNHYGLYAGIDPAYPLQFQFGGTTVFEVLYANFHIENDSYQGGPGGGIIGGLKLFSLETDFVYQTPGDFKLTALIPQFDIDIPTIASDLLGTDFPLPTWLPVITFPKTSLFVLRQGSGTTATDTFALLAQPSFGAIVLQVVKQQSGWVLAAGLQLNSPKIAAFDSLSMLSGMDNLFSVNELLFLFCSGNLDGGFQFPLTTDFAGGSGKNIQVPNFAGTVKGGFYFYGSMTLNLTKQPNLALIPKMFNVDATFNFQLYVFLGFDPAQNALVQAGLQGKINDSTTFAGYLGAKMESGEPQIYVEGIITTTIQGSGGTSHQLTTALVARPKGMLMALPTAAGDTLTGAIEFELTPNAAFLSASMIGKVSFGPITLANLVIVVGIDFEGIPSLGFAAQIDLAAYNTTYDTSIAFFFDSGDPAKSLFAGSISDVTLKQIADTIVGTVTGGDQPPAWLDDLLAQVGVRGTNTFLLPATTATALDGSDYAAITTAFNTASPGVSYSFSRQNTLLVVGATDLGKPGEWYITNFPASNIIAHYELTTQSDGQIVVSLEPQFYYCMPPGGGSVVLGPTGAGLTFNSGVALSGQLDFFMLHLVVDISIVPNKGFAAELQVLDPVVIIPNYLQMTGNQDPTRGPFFSMSTYTVQQTDPITHQPVMMPAHFYLDGKVTLLGLTAATTINVSAAGLLLDLELSAGDASIGADFAVKTTLDSATGFSFGISADVHINKPNFELFNVDLGTLDLVVDISAGLTFAANSQGISLTVADTNFTFGSINFSLPGFELDVTTQQLTDIAGIIYDEVKNLIWDFLKDAENWLLWVGSEIIKGVEDIEKVLNDVFNAIASVWGNEKRIVVAVSESFASSQSTTITLTPATPGNGITQDMLDAAQAWAQQTAEVTVSRAIITQIKMIPPDDVGNFQVNSVQVTDQTYELNQNVNWFLTPHASLPSLTALGFQNPMADTRFFNQTTVLPQFQTAISLDADFTQVSRVTLTARYNNAVMNKPYIFTSAAPHTFSAPWNSAAADNYEVQFTITFLNPQIQSITTGWLLQKGPVLVIPIGVPASAELVA